MDACLISALVVVIIFVVGVILVILIGRRPKSLCSIPSRDVFTYRHELINKLTSQNYKIKEKENGNIFVEKDFFSATTLVLKQNGANIDILFIHSNTNSFLIVFIVLFLFVWIGAIVLAIIADSNSKGFRNNELKPLLNAY